MRNRRPTDPDAPESVAALPALGALLHAYALKDEPRQGWVLRGTENPESVAAHTWGTSLLCLLFADEAGVDPGEALAIATVHDLAEAEIGDIPSREDPRLRSVSVDEKARMERAAMERLETALGERGANLTRFWERYEDRSDLAARFVRDMNLVDMALQALMYHRTERHADDADLREFLRSAEARAEGDVAQRLLAEVRRAFEAPATEPAVSTP